MRKFLVTACLLVPFTVLLSACSPASESPTPDFNVNPQIPGGSINTDPATLAVGQFTANPLPTGEIDLKWTNPSQYSTLTYQVLVFRKQCVSTSSFCVEPSPKSAAAQSLYLIYNGTESSYLDTNVQSGLTYNYWVFVLYNTSYSAGARAEATSVTGVSSLASITKTNFWPNASWTVGQVRTPNSNYSPSVYLLGANKLNESDIGGKAALGANGTLLYYADTTNNRVVIMVKQIGYQCMTANYTDPLQLRACLSQSTGEPFVPMNVLGQPNGRTNLSCQAYRAQCGNTANNVSATTNSTGQTVYQVVSDSDHTTVTGTFSSQVEARRSACESSNFCSFEGTDAGKVCVETRDKCMSAPTHVAVDGTRLLVADSNNDRILIYSTLPTQYSACDLNIGADIVVQDNCSANSVIGKKTVGDLTDYSKANYANTQLISLNLPAGPTTLKIGARGALTYNLAGLSLESVSPGSTNTTSASPAIIPTLGKTIIDVTSASEHNGTTLDASSSPVAWGKVLPGAYLKFKLDVASAGVYQLKLNYSAILNDTYVDVSIDDVRQASINLTPSGGGIYSDGDKTLSKPGAMAFKDGMLYIADRGNNRVVRARGYADANLFACTTNETAVAGGTAYGDWNSLCKFDHVLGQQTLFENLSFSQIVFDKAAQGFDVISSVGAGNFLTAAYENLLKRYIGSPTALTITEDGKVLVSGDENFLLDSGNINTLAMANPRYSPWYLARIDRSPVALKSRIMIFDEALLTSIQPSCQPSVFGIGGCDASSVIGQLDFKTLPIFSGGAADDYRNSISYGLTYVTDFIVNGKSLMAVDPVTNDIYFWKDWTLDVQGRPFNFRIENPAGAAFPSQPNRAMPNLRSLSGILFDDFTQTFTLTDPGSGLLYQVNKPR